MLTDKRSKILLLLEGGTGDLKEALLRGGGEKLCSGGPDFVLKRFLEAAAGCPLASFQQLELWELPPEGPPSAPEPGGEGGAGGSEMPVREASFRVPVYSGAFSSLGLIVVFPKDRESPALTPLDKELLAELARQGGSARMGVLSLKLGKAAYTLKKRMKYLEHLGFVRLDGKPRKPLYVLLRGAEDGTLTSSPAPAALSS